MEIDKFNEVVTLRDKREELTSLLNKLNGDGNVAISYYSDVFDEILCPSLHEFEDLQKELNSFVKNWFINKINEIDNTIKEL